MLSVALKMLMGDRAKYLGLLFGITFTSFLVTFAASYFCGFMTRGFALIAENGETDVWIMDPAVASVELLGDTKFLHVRVDVDENDAWRVQPNAPALAFVRGNPDLNASLQFERFEPYVIPKVSLTGQSTERTDTRVLQVIYSFDPVVLPVYVGQQVDVFIEAPPIGRTSTRMDASRKIQ